VSRDDEDRLVYRELARHVRPARVITAFANSERGWEHSALRMLENYCLTWGGAADLLVPVSGDAVVHEAIWPLIEMFDADFWATYNRTRREFMLADPAGFESWLEGKAAAWADEHESSPAQARTMFTADRILDAPVGHLQLSDELLGEIKRRTAPVLWPEADVHVGYYGADTTPGFPIIDVSELRPLPVRVQVMDTASLPSALRVLVAMKCGGLAPRQQARVRRAGVAVEQVQVGLDDLDVVAGHDHAGGDLARPGALEIHALGPVAVHAQRQALDVEHDVGHVLAHAGDGGEFVQHPVDLHLRDSGPAHGRQQDPPQGVPEGMAEAPLERFQRHPRPRRAEFLYADLSRREQFVHRLCHVCVILRSLGLAASRSVPSL